MGWELQYPLPTENIPPEERNAFIDSRRRELDAIGMSDGADPDEIGALMIAIETESRSSIFRVLEVKDPADQSPLKESLRRLLSSR